MDKLIRLTAQHFDAMRKAAVSKERGRSTTQTFGTGPRESHDASAFYSRFETPILSSETEINPQPEFEFSRAIRGDSRQMHHLADNCVALVVTSPPYFAGKDYETPEAAARNQKIPTTFKSYLNMLYKVFSECERVLEPGGRIAINVANLGRKPYRSLSSEVTEILRELGFFLRGEIIWQKAEGAGNSCAWGSYRSATNPVLRDLTERIIVASKGQFNRAISTEERKLQNLPFESTIGAEEFLESTQDLWYLSPVSAKKIGHPAPFPLELPMRLICLYTYKGDLVLDPFMGSGTTLVASKMLNRNYIGYDTSLEYVKLARSRIEAIENYQQLGKKSTSKDNSYNDDTNNSISRIVMSQPVRAKEAVENMLIEAGFKILSSPSSKKFGAQFTFSIENIHGDTFLVDVVGSFTLSQNKNSKSVEILFKTLGKILLLKSTNFPPPVLLFVTQLPEQGSESDRIFRRAGWKNIFDIIDINDYFDGKIEWLERLKCYAHGEINYDNSKPIPVPGYWNTRDLLN